MNLKRDSELRIILEAEIKEAKSLRKWAAEKGISPASGSIARLGCQPFPPIIATAFGYEKIKDARRWTKST